MSDPVITDHVHHEKPQGKLARYLRRMADELEKPGVTLVVRPLWLQCDVVEGQMRRLRVDVEIVPPQEPPMIRDYLKPQDVV